MVVEKATMNTMRGCVHCVRRRFIIAQKSIYAYLFIAIIVTEFKNKLIHNNVLKETSFRTSFSFGLHKLASSHEAKTLL